MWMKQHFTNLNSSCFWKMPFLRPLGGKNDVTSILLTWMASFSHDFSRGALQTFHNQKLLGVIFGNISPIQSRINHGFTDLTNPKNVKPFTNQPTFFTCEVALSFFQHTFGNLTLSHRTVMWNERVNILKIYRLQKLKKHNTGCWSDNMCISVYHYINIWHMNLYISDVLYKSCSFSIYFLYLLLLSSSFPWFHQHINCSKDVLLSRIPRWTAWKMVPWATALGGFQLWRHCQTETKTKISRRLETCGDLLNFWCHFLTFLLTRYWSYDKHKKNNNRIMIGIGILLVCSIHSRLQN